MELMSPTLGEWFPLKYVYRGYGCTGDNLSPPLEWRGEPPGTQSFAITMHDPDAPHPGGWWHWIVFNIPSTVHAIPEGAGAWLQELGALESVTTFGEPGYGGPCPPVGHGPHRYYMTVWALPVAKAPLTVDTPPEQAARWIEGHALDSATIMARFERR